jgi:B9 domain-containing protein 2
MINSKIELQKLSGDYKTEVHYIGQVRTGHGFETDIGLYCEIQLEYGEHWSELPQASNAPIQTHTSYPGVDDVYVWCHPIDLHFATDSIFDSPKLIIRVWRLDDLGRTDLLSYGVCQLPCNSGSCRLECPTWRPIGNWRDEAISFFIGGPPRLANEDALNKNLSLRKKLKTVSSGIVSIELEILLKNFDKHWTVSKINT